MSPLTCALTSYQTTFDTPPHPHRWDAVLGTTVISQVSVPPAGSACAQAVNNLIYLLFRICWRHQATWTRREPETRLVGAGREATMIQSIVAREGGGGSPAFKAARPPPTGRSDEKVDNIKRIQHPAPAHSSRIRRRTRCKWKKTIAHVLEDSIQSHRRGKRPSPVSRLLKRRSLAASNFRSKAEPIPRGPAAGDHYRRSINSASHWSCRRVVGPPSWLAMRLGSRLT